MSFRCLSRRHWRVLALLAALQAGCSTMQRRTEAYQPALPAGTRSVGVIFAANGAGDFGTLSQNLAQALDQTATPLELKTVDWSLGYRRYVVDQVDHDNHLAKGRRLADEVVAYRMRCPERGIYLVGHSAGCAVLLAAAELLPPDSVDRIILLAPSVCRTADLRPALRAARCGIDVFYSENDRLILGLGMRIVGTTESGCREAAGRHGFTPLISSPADAALYGRLRQHPWHPAHQWAGHDGGHFGNNQTAFLRLYVLPLLACQ